MDNLIDKDKRIKFLEETIKRLLRERSEWESKAHKLENRLKAQELSVDIYRDNSSKDVDFLNHVGELIRPILHDVRGQLNFIQQVIFLIIKNLKNENNLQLTEILKNLNLCIGSIKYLDKRITDMSYLGSKLPDIFTKVEVNELVRENIEFIQDRYKDFKIKLDLYNGLIEIMADKESLNQIITNLTINAIEACEPSKGHITVATKKSDTKPQFIQIMFKDNGAGIPPNEINNIYDLHYTTKKTGFGIGLYLVKKAVELHKGKISCESIPNSGTSFVVTLPIRQENSNDYS